MKTGRSRIAGAVAAGLLMALSQAAVQAHDAKGGQGKKDGHVHAGKPDPKPDHKPGGHPGNGPKDLAGAWLVSMMPYDCATGNSIPTAAYEALFTFHEDGTLSVWAQNNTITTTRSPSHGVWKSMRDGTYRLTFVHLRYAGAVPGAYLGRQDAVGTVTLLGKRGEEFSMESRATVYDTHGAVTANACGRSSAVRIVVPD